MYYFFVSIILFQILYFSISDDRLVFLYTHFRHGARAQEDINDSFYDELGEKWTNPGELTGVGQRMHYILGLRNRKKYVKDETFLSEKFDPHEMLIFSSNYNRTMISCSSQLQGLYPQKDNLGEILSLEQKKMAYPQVNITDEKINKALIELGNSSLPNLMILTPVRMVGNLDKIMNVYDLKESKKARNAIFEKNFDNLPDDYFEKFRDKYASSLNKYYKKEIKPEFDFYQLCDIYDVFVCDYVDGRNMSEFKEKTNLDFDEFYSDCLEYLRKIYLDVDHGDKEKALAHVDSSKIMQELIYYMKRRLDSDMTEINEDDNYKDYSRPKMIMTSGHDSTDIADEIFIIRALGLNETDIFAFPRYASQLALEVRTAINEGKTKHYSDYYILGYFNDRQIFNVKADEFIEKIQNEIWDENKINDFCGINNNNNGTNDNNKKSDNAKTAYKVLMSVFICTSAILLTSAIILVYKLSKSK